MSENMSSSNDHSSSNNDEENDGGLGGWARTKRAQLLQDLHSLVPNQIETDERSILEGARDYLQRIHEETEQIERELPEKYASSSESQGPQILGVKKEMGMTEEELQHLVISAARRSGLFP
ncbi:uncharacterized protein LOC131257621 isoform X2 [Magnolia sinica]|uniref:uncharacterized protein LOC131257621 isoform X2 n=1 Tax=Magnolia sinica TaxID=86752 RepID=UPI00265AFF6F|nr:uncharacterized protein LOC131257621 isoform X2 [Magnolia sinica]